MTIVHIPFGQTNIQESKFPERLMQVNNVKVISITKQLI